jgi:hypothetical protein
VQRLLVVVVVLVLLLLLLLLQAEQKPAGPSSCCCLPHAFVSGYSLQQSCCTTAMHHDGRGKTSDVPTSTWVTNTIKQRSTAQQNTSLK